MPFKSKAQRKWMHANKPEMAKEWEAETPDNAHLPERLGKKKKAGKEMLRDAFSKLEKSQKK